jgi:hypothetical protein
MRSEYVFAAAKKISSRFLLCRVTAVSARRLHIDSKQSSETINKSLRLIAASAMAQGRVIVDGKPETEYSVFLRPIVTPKPDRHEQAAEPQLELETVPAG